MEDILKQAASPWRMPKVEKIFQQLGALASRNKLLGQQTVADDAAVPADKQAAIVQQEELVRGALGMFGISYDELIAMDGKSVYSQAVAAQPELARQVVGSDMPVLSALKIAVDYQPYADFAAKYGRTPEDIKKNMQAEMQAATPPDKGAAEPAPRAPLGPIFSAYASGGRSGGAARKKTDLASLFGR